MRAVHGSAGLHVLRTEPRLEVGQIVEPLSELGQALPILPRGERDPAGDQSLVQAQPDRRTSQLDVVGGCPGLVRLPDGKV